MQADMARDPVALRQQDVDEFCTLGNFTLLRLPLLALFCSVKCPGELILQTYDLARALRDAGVPVIGGFHSPMEQECLTLLLRGTQPIVICPARAIEGMRVPMAWRPAVEQGRLLVASPFPKSCRRVTTETAQRRNTFVAALAERLFIAYAARGSKTEQLARDWLARGKKVLTFNSPDNAELIALGARTMQPGELDKLLW